MTIAFASLLFLCITGDANSVPKEEIKRVVREFVLAHLDTSKEEAMIEFRSIPETTVPLGDPYTLRIAAEVVPPLRGNLSLPVEIVVQGHAVGRSIVSLRIRRYGVVFVTSRQLDRHAPLSDADIVSRRIETTLMPADFITDKEQLRRKRTTRILAAGTVLRESNVETIPLVNQNDLVTLVIRTGAVRLFTQAVAKGDGREGDFVTVQTSATRQKIRARVASEKTVELLIE